MFLATLWGVMMVVIIYHVLKGMEKGRYLLHDCKIKNRFLKFVVDFTVTILWLLLFIAVASNVIYDTNKYYVSTAGGSNTISYGANCDLDYVGTWSDTTESVYIPVGGAGVYGTYKAVYEPSRYVYEPVEISTKLNFNDWVEKVYGKKKNEYEVELI